MASFVGHTLEIRLQDQSTITGNVLDIDPSGKILLDVLATLSLPDGSVRTLDARTSVARQNIANASIVALAPAQKEKQDHSRKPSKTLANPQKPWSTSSSLSDHDPAILSVHSTADPESAAHKSDSDVSSLRLSRRSKNTNKQFNNGNSKQHPNKSKSKSSANFYEDFDFQKGLESFDKQKVFAEIRQQDDSDKSQLLVSHNLSTDPRYRKLKPTETVLEPHEQPDSLVVNYPLSRPSSCEADSSTAASCTVTSKQWKEILDLADIETGPNLVQRVENAGRGVASFIMQTLGQERALFPLDPKGQLRPRISLLSGTMNKGCCGLRAAVHLLNRGAYVTAFVPSQNLDSLPAGYAFHLRLFTSAGGKVVHSLEDLPDSQNTDLIIDAYMDNDTHLKKRINKPTSSSTPATTAASTTSTSTSTPSNNTSNRNTPSINTSKSDVYDAALFDWLSRRRGNDHIILSIDCPSGYDFDQGPKIPNPVSPHYTIALGALKNPSPNTALTQVSTHVAIADIGLPNMCFERAGASHWSSPFHTQWVVQIS